MADQHPDPTSESGAIDAELGEAAMRSLGEGPAAPVRQSHPPGLWVLFITEMWERFSYYGMRAILVLFLIASSAETVIPEDGGEAVANANPGFGWSKADAYTLYGVYTFMVYFGGIFGGIAADRLLGTHRSMLVGGWIIALGHITLAISGLFSFERGQAVTMATGPGALSMFLLGLTFIIIGTGFFKPCVSVMVGQLYAQQDPRRDSGFTIFYMGINLGAFFSPLVAGTLGEKVGWHWGFGSAAVGMLAGLTCYQLFRPRYLQGIGLPAEPKPSARDVQIFLGVVAALVAIPMLPLVLFVTGGLGEVVSAWHWLYAKVSVWGVTALVVAVLGGTLAAFLLSQPRNDRGPLGVIIALAFLGNIFFWTAFEQAGSSLNVFAKEDTDRTLWGLLEGDGFPASWYQSINPLAILVFAPVFAWLWVWLEGRRANPSTPLKFAIGLWLLGLAFLAMVFGALEARGEGKLAGPHWLLITYVVVTWGELCLSPVGLSMVTKLAPARLQSQMMGFWFFTFALSNLFAGLVARFSTKFVPDPETGAAPTMTFVMEGLPGFFLMLVVFPIGAGVVILGLTPILKRMMHGVK